MRIPTIWYKHSEVIEVDDWISKETYSKVMRMHHFWGGSSISEEDAKANALLKRDIIKSKIDGNFEYGKDPNYQVDIKEEIIGKVDENNVITRNRYGALVLNSAHIMIVDIDNDRIKRQVSLIKVFTDILTLLKMKKKYSEGVLGIVERKLLVKRHAHLYTRVYETPNGYRLIILGQSFNARSIVSLKMMKKLSADWEYAKICYQQDCFRARLTPKPWRIAIKRPKIIFPFRTLEEDENHNEWVSKYQQKSENYAACRLIKEYGKPIQSNAVDYHDKFCKAFSNLPLA